MSSDAVAGSPAVVELTEADIPGASLEEPLDAHNVAALKWWLLCRGIKLQSSSRKKQLVARLVLSPVKSLKSDTLLSFTLVFPQTVQRSPGILSASDLHNRTR